MKTKFLRIGLTESSLEFFLLSALYRENNNNNNTNNISNLRGPEKARENAVASTTPALRWRGFAVPLQYDTERMRGVALEPAGWWAQGFRPRRILGPSGCGTWIQAHIPTHARLRRCEGVNPTEHGPAFPHGSPVDRPWSTLYCPQLAQKVTS